MRSALIIRTRVVRQVAAYPVLVVAWTLTLVGALTSVVGIGVPLFLLGTALTRTVAGWHLAWAEEALGRPVRWPARTTPEATSFGRRFLDELGDADTWRRFGWATLTMLATFLIPVLSLALLASAAWYAGYPLTWSLAPDGSIDAGYGVWTSDTQAESFHTWALAAVALLIWWWASPLLERLAARTDETVLLGSEEARLRALESRVDVLTSSRAALLDDGVSDLRRLERDIHDGAQARMVATGMHLGTAIDVLDSDPESARESLLDAHDAITAAIRDLRAVVKGVVPPVLADRGLAGAVQSLAIAMPMDVEVVDRVTDGPIRTPIPKPVETTAYFAAAELLTNVAKHAAARNARVVLERTATTLSIEVSDDGRGGASPAAGSGLAELGRRIANVEGSVVIDSPVGGPTTARVELPCASS